MTITMILTETDTAAAGVAAVAVVVAVAAVDEPVTVMGGRDDAVMVRPGDAEIAHWMRMMQVATAARR